MSEAQEPGNLPLPEKISESQIVPDSATDTQTDTPESEENCCGTSKDCKNGTDENEEDDNASESDWKPEGSGESLMIYFLISGLGNLSTKNRLRDMFFSSAVNLYRFL